MTIDMSTTRTDLALESVQAACSGAETGTISGVRSRERTREGYAVTDIRVEDEDGAQALGKPVGRYVTVDLGPYFRREADYFDRGVRCLAGELAALLPEGPVLAAGLGNRAMTCDAVGPASIDNLLVTRHMIRAMPRQFADFRPVAAVCPGVLARTGLEALELVRGAVERVRPAAVIAVDALAARETDEVHIFSEYEGAVGMTVTDEGLGVIGMNGASGIISHTVMVNIPTATEAGTSTEWIYDTYGIIIPDNSLLEYISPDGRTAFGYDLSGEMEPMRKWYVTRKTAE